MRHHSIKLDEDLEPLLSFLAPILADKSQPSVQVFFRRKEDLVGASKKRQKCALLKSTFKQLEPCYFSRQRCFLKANCKETCLGDIHPRDSIEGKCFDLKTKKVNFDNTEADWRH